MRDFMFFFGTKKATISRLYTLLIVWTDLLIIQKSIWFYYFIDSFLYWLGIYYVKSLIYVSPYSQCRNPLLGHLWSTLSRWCQVYFWQCLSQRRVYFSLNLYNSNFNTNLKTFRKGKCRVESKLPNWYISCVVIKPRIKVIWI